MDWQLMVIGQLAVMLLGTAGVCGWQILKLRRRNQALFEELQAATGDAPAEPAAVAAAPEEESPQEHAPDSEAVDHAEPATAPETSPVQANAEEMPETEAQAAVSEASPAIDAQTQGPDGIKKLLQQFMLDSRDMVERIELLEQQTRTLIAEATADTGPPAPEAEAEDVPPTGEESEESSETAAIAEPAQAAGSA